ncbi:MAG: M48 family metallopeptidase [Lachnospiraceae bacterium]|nr:M48 family metallopeptidase [Lachnospiraceae bacterium]
MNVKVIKSNRKTISIQINPDLSVTLRVPLRISKRDIEKILEEKRDWIEKHIEKVKAGNEARDEGTQRLSVEELKSLADRALAYIPSRVRHFAPLVGVSYGRITIRNQKTRWGSCSGKGNLNFNCLLMLTLPEVIDYVVVHELCHRKEMNHSKRFWGEVEKVIPNYKEMEKWLKTNGSALIRRSPM